MTSALVVSPTYPSASGGSAINLRVLVQALRALEYSVHFVKLDIGDVDVRSDPSTVDEFAAQHRVAAARLWSLDAEATARIAAIARDAGTQIALFQGYESIAVLDPMRIGAGLRGIVLGDPYELVCLERARNAIVDCQSDPLGIARAVRSVQREIGKARKWSRIARRLRVFDFGYATAAHHARRYQRINPRINYQPSPVLAPRLSVSVVADTMEAKIASPEFRLLYIGHNLGGTSNRVGVRDLVRLLAAASRVTVPGRSWRVLLAGDAEAMPAWAKGLLQRDQRVSWLGPVDLDSVMGEVHVLLNPISRPLGNRTRIASAFAHGVPAFSHRVALAGMPSLDEVGGALLFETPEEFAAHLSLLMTDDGVYRRLVREAARSYESLYSAANLARCLNAQLVGCAEAHGGD